MIIYTFKVHAGQHNTQSVLMRSLLRDPNLDIRF